MIDPARPSDRLALEPATPSDSHPSTADETLAYSHGSTPDPAPGADLTQTLPGANPTANPSTSFGRYRIESILGNGAMGTVYLAEDSQLHRRVALKVPRFAATPSSTELERLYREARAAAKLSHPHICPIHDVGEHAGTHFISMAFVDGKTLASEIATGPRKSDRDIAVLVRKLALALDEAHRQGIIHRDLKPGNVMIDRRSEPVLMDFGLARQLGDQDARLTQDGVIVGTPAYMSPEQVQGDRHLGPATDVYSLGVILYELLTGRTPFQGTVTSIIGQVLHVDPPPIRELRPDCPPELADICTRAIQKQPQERFGSMQEFARALGDCLDRLAIASSRQSRYLAKLRRRPVWLWWFAGAAALTVVTCIVHVLQSRPSAIEHWNPPPPAGSTAVPTAEPNWPPPIDFNPPPPSDSNPDPPHRKRPFQPMPRPDEVLHLGPQGLLQQLDRNRNGVLEEHEVPRHVIDRVDMNGDGELTLDELEDAIHRLGPGFLGPPGQMGPPGRR